MNPLNILMAQSDRSFKTNEKDPAPPAALLNFSFMSSIQIVPEVIDVIHFTKAGFTKKGHRRKCL